MAEKGEGMMIGDPSCAWVRDWLPLLAGDSEDISGEGCDLGAEDRRLMESHLDRCESCRRHRASLEGALSILGAAAIESPVDPLTPSVWLSLEEEIRVHQGKERSRWAVVVQSVCPRSIHAAAERLSRSWQEIRDQLPFQIAWVRDSAWELLEARSRLPRLDSALGPVRSTFVPRLALGSAMACLVFLIVAPLVHRRQVQAEVQIAANAAPLPAVHTAPFEPTLSSEVNGEPEAESSPVESLAQADLPPPATEAQPPALRGPGASAKASAAASSPSSRYDLEYGIPMPRDSRGGKPAY